MGFYIRKSIKAGPFRFNVSKSGVGVSAGVPGFRVGTGPRGNYVSVGANGVYYRTTLPAPPAGTPPMPFEQQFSSAVLLEDVTGATALILQSTTGDDIVAQLNAAAARRRWGWPALVGLFFLGLVTMPAGMVVWVAAVPICIWLFMRDAARRTVVLFYDVNDGAASWFDALVQRWSALMSSAKVWRVVQAGNVQTTYQHKTNAGASSLVSRVAVVSSLGGPPHLATNVAVPTVVAGKASMHFLPDRVLVREGRRYADVSYRELLVRARRERFIEGPGPLPRDAQQVGQTWQYVNVKGGPDRRFANNPVLPIALYGAVDLLSPQGLSWFLQTSRGDAAPSIADVLGSNPMRA